MAHQGINIENVKVNNRASVLQLLLSNGPMPRSDLAAALNLTPATVTTICSEFLNKSLLIQREETVEPAKVGRKKCPVELNYDYLHVLAINIHTAVTNISLCNLRGDKIAGNILPSQPAVPPEEFLGRVAACCAKLLWDNQLTGDNILGAGVTILGPVNHIDGISLNAFCLWDKPVNVKKILEQELHMRVCVESNVVSLLSAELLYSNLQAQNILAVKWGPGVGSASVINGRVFKGRNFQSAELGHNFVDRAGKRCRCGKVGCLETKLSIEAIAEKILDLAKEEPEGIVARAVVDKGIPDRKNLQEFLILPDSALQNFLDEASYALAVVVNNAIQILAPDKLILYGDVFFCQSMLDRFRKRVFSINDTLTEDIFLKSDLETRKDYIGAVSVVVKHLLVDTGGL